MNKSFLQRAKEYLFGSCVKQKPHRDSFGKIALIVPHSKDMWAISVAQSFISSLREVIGYQRAPEIDLLCAQNESLSIQRDIMGTIRAEHEAGTEYVAIVTVGTWCAKEVCDVLEAWQLSIPHIFCGVEGPVELGLVDSLEETGRRTTGVIGLPHDYQKEIDLFLSLKPDAQHVLVPYDSYEYDDAMRQVMRHHEKAISAACAERNIQLFLMPLAAESDTPRIIEEFLKRKRVDAVCTLVDTATRSQMEQIVAVCNQYGVTVCASDLSSVYQGAAIGFGYTGHSLGVSGAGIIYEMLINKQDIEHIGVITLSEKGSMKCNHEMLAKQGVILSPLAANLISISSIYQE